MQKAKLKEHIKNGDTLYTIWTNPSGMGHLLSLTNWAKDSLPEYVWIAVIIDKLGRTEGLKSVYNIAEELKNKSISKTKLSSIFSLSNDEQNEFWNIVCKYVDIEVLSPLSIIITPDINDIFYNNFYLFDISAETQINYLIKLTKQCLNFHDNLTTDVCFAAIWFKILEGKFVVSSKMDVLPKALSEYYKKSHDDEEMKMYESSIRASFQTLNVIEKTDKSWCNTFWKKLGELSECNALVIEREKNEVDEEFYSLIKKTIDYIQATNSDKKLETKYSVILGMVCYILKIYDDIILNNLANKVSGRILFRTMIETYINLKYLMAKESEEPDVYEKFKAYGIGKYKLVMAKLREGKYSVSDKSQIKAKYIELLTNEEISENFLNVSFGFFDSIRIKEKFNVCNENELYEIFYEYGTNYSHGFWGAIRESSMLPCDNPAHAYHDIPDYHNEQESISILDDCKMLIEKLFAILPPYIELPEFYTNQVEGQIND